MELDLIIFEAGGRKLALDLSVVQEVFTLGHITPVPLSPGAIEGAANLRGRMVPVIRLEPLLGDAKAASILPGTHALLGVADGHQAALPVQRVVDVVTVNQNQYREGGPEAESLLPGTVRAAGSEVSVLDLGTALNRIRLAADNSYRRVTRRTETWG